MLSQLRESGLGPYSPAIIRDLRIYGGAAGIWVDRATTSVTTDNPIGAAVSVNHTGEHYPDDLSETGLIYHYPVTRRPGLTDSNEIDATKRTRALGLPLLQTRRSEYAYFERTRATASRQRAGLSIFPRRLPSR